MVHKLGNNIKNDKMNGWLVKINNIIFNLIKLFLNFESKMLLISEMEDYYY